MSTVPSTYGGACIIACVCVGAGMLGLPTAGAGVWTEWALTILVLTMLLMTFSGCLLLEAYSAFPYKVSFSSVTQSILGTPVNVINNIAVYFVGGILLYAYITSAGLVIGDVLDVDNKIASVVYVLFFSFFVWHSTRWVDRISVLLILFMALTFVFSISGLTLNIDRSVLLDLGGVADDNSYMLYIAPMLPVALASFGYHHSVSSLRDYYRCEKRAAKALIGGTSIALIVYVVWLVVIYGNLPRSEFVSVIEQGGNVDALLNKLGSVIEVSLVSQVLNAFSMAAILSSFIGVGLGVFDFLADFFKFEDTKTGRAKTWAVTFIPPLIFSLLFPFGFLVAIGYAAFAAATWACIIPALLVGKLRAQAQISKDEQLEPAFKVMGGSLVLWLCFLFGVSIMAIHVLNVSGQLPIFSG